MSNRIGHILCRNCHLKHTTEGNIEGKIEVTGRQRRRREQLLDDFNPLKPELNPICYLLALLAHHFLHVIRIRVKSLTIRLLMSYIYIYMEHLFLMFLDHTQRRSTVVGLLWTSDQLVAETST